MQLPNNVRLRPDLVIQPQDGLGGTWVVKDPVALRYFLFGSDEHYFLERLDGTRTAKELIDDFARDRAPRQMTTQRLQMFLYDLFRKGLVCTDAVTHGQRLLEQEDNQTRRDMLAAATNWLAIRLPGINPGSWLDWLHSNLRWCFTQTFFLLCALTWAGALMVLLANGDSLWAEFPRAQDFLQGRNLLWLGIALAGTKVLHELGHAVTCRHFGGSCHELGLMFLLFTPCLYCNVTDAWMLRGRWQRIAISAAGILVELQLAALATIAWYFTLPGPLHSICLSVILVCSVGTILFNGNPLLKFDGYFIVSDFFRIPNLWEQSRQVLHARISRLFVRDPREQPPPAGPMDGALTIYAIASMAYRVILLTTIALFLYRALHPQGLDLVFLLFGTVVLGGMGFATFRSLGTWLRRPGAFRQLRAVPIALMAGGIVILSAIVLAIPFPCRIPAPIVLQPKDVGRVYATTPGELVYAVDYGQPVGQGELLAKLTDPALRSDLIEVSGQLKRAQTKVQSLEASAATSPVAASQLQVTRTLVADLQEQVRLKQQEADGLRIEAPRAGQVIPPDALAPTNVTAEEIPAWTGTPFDVANQGCFLERGTLLCLVADPEVCEAIAFVDEEDVRYVRVGQTARIQMTHSKREFREGQVVEVSKVNTEEIPRELAAMHDVAFKQAASGGTVPLRSVYQIRVELELFDTPQQFGTRGQARIEVAPQSIARRCWRWLLRTINTGAGGVS